VIKKGKGGGDVAPKSAEKVFDKEKGKRRGRGGELSDIVKKKKREGASVANLVRTIETAEQRKQDAPKVAAEKKSKTSAGGGRKKRTKETRIS